MPYCKLLQSKQQTSPATLVWFNCKELTLLKADGFLVVPSEDKRGKTKKKKKQQKRSQPVSHSRLSSQEHICKLSRQIPLHATSPPCCQRRSSKCSHLNPSNIEIFRRTQKHSISQVRLPYCFAQSKLG